jgi:hypothetical protein
MARKKREPPQYRPPERDRDAIEEVRKCVAEAKKWHNSFAKRVERRYDAWRGLIPDDTKPKGWRSNQHPPYLINIIEGMLSSLEETNPTWLITPRVYPGLTMDEVVDRTEGAEVISYLLDHQMRIDGFQEKAGPYAHQDLIAGLTVGKIHWLKKDTVRKERDEVPELIYDEAGGSIDVANRLDVFEQTITVRDDPTFEVRDIRDFMYPASATSLETAPWVIDRTFVTYETLVRMEDLGVYRNTKYVKDTREGDTQADADAVRDRERRLRGIDRTSGLVEIVELWTDKKVVTVANGTVLLRNAANPFEHGRKPFVVCSAIPDLFQIPGVSVIEGLAQMQEMLWTLQNMRLDASRIASNVITLIRGDVDYPEQYEWAPEAQWIVPDPNAVRVMDMGAVAQAAASTLQSEGLLRGDIQNVMGGLPFTGGAESQNLPVNTATGMSIITNIAQAILARRKIQYQRAYGKIGQMFLELDQQFMTDDRLVEVLGEEGARRYFEVGPLDIQGVYDVELEVTGESMMRQERRAENQALTTMAVQAAPVMQQLGVPLNLRRFWERLLDSYGISDKATFFAEQQAGAPGEGMGTPPGIEEILGQMQQGALPPGGQTNPALAAGPTSPSSEVSMSPASMAQQSMARAGAGRAV